MATHIDIYPKINKQIQFDQDYGVSGGGATYNEFMESPSKSNIFSPGKYDVIIYGASTGTGAIMTTGGSCVLTATLIAYDYFSLGFYFGTRAGNPNNTGRYGCVGYKEEVGNKQYTTQTRIILWYPSEFISGNALATVVGSGKTTGTTYQTYHYSNDGKLLYELTDVIIEYNRYFNCPGFMRLTFRGGLEHNVYCTNCTPTKTTASKEESITCTANINHTIKTSYGTFYVNDNLGIFRDFSYAYVNPLSTNGITTTFIMPDRDVYITANFYSYRIICTRYYSIADNILIPGKTYRIKAEGFYNGRPFIYFQISGVSKVIYISRTEISFVMPPNNVSFTAMYLGDRVNTDIYKNPNLQEVFDFDKLLQEEIWQGH